MAPRHLRLTAETAALTTREPAMEIVDLSREIFHRTQTHPSHPPVIITVWNDHNEKVTAGKTTFSSKALSISFSDHAGTHVDAPIHFDRPAWRRHHRPNAARELLHLRHLPRSLACAAEARDHGSGDGGGARQIGRGDPAEGHRADLHGDERPAARHARLRARLSRTRARDRCIGSPTRASACSASRR